MEKISYEKSLLVKPIKKPDKIDLLDHLIIFASDDSISVAIPDFNEVYFDSYSSNIANIPNDTEMHFFEIVDIDNIENMCNEVPIYAITVSSNNLDSNLKIVSSKCINGFSLSLEETITNTKVLQKVKWDVIY